MKRLLLFLLLHSSLTCISQEIINNGYEVALKARKLDSGFVNSSAKVAMTLTNSRGRSVVRKMKLFVNEVPESGNQSLIIFHHPKDVNGTAVLTHTNRIDEDDQWLYLPSINRVKRISSSNKSGPFMGSEFAFEDLASQEIEKYQFSEDIEVRDLNGISCYVVARKPVYQNSGYSRQVVWYNSINFRVEKIDFFDRKGIHIKTLNFSDYEKFENRYWRSLSMTMENHITGNSTLMSFVEYEFQDEGITEFFFTPQNLSSINK